ncbi:MAG: hypothetical protein KC468_14620 [Myxococcales bacterium]|nr:hypothetical protein [Myxococcales bacterium]
MNSLAASRLTRATMALTTATAIAVVSARPAQAATTSRSSLEAPADAPDWAASFEPDALARELGDGAPKLMVVAAGARAEAAALALREGLTASGGTSLVMDSEAIGDVAGLDDRSIVARVKTMPIDQVLIVRVFDGGPGAPPSVVVNGYDKAGAVVLALTGAAGTPLTASDSSDASALEPEPDQGDDDASAEEPDEAAAERERANRRDRIRRYKASYLWAEDWVGVSAETGQVLRSWTVFRQGEGGAPLKGADFYRVLGRDDLEDEYRRRVRIRYGVGVSIIVAGVGITIAGATISLNSIDTAPDFGDDDPLMLGSIDQSPKVSRGATTGMITGGALAMGVGLLFMSLFKSHPVKRGEAGRLIEKYNNDLRDKLGIEEVARGLQIAPLVGPVQGVGVRGQF